MSGGSLRRTFCSIRRAFLGAVLAAGVMAATSAAAIAPVGTIDEFALPSAASAPNAITAGPDGNLWFTEQTGNAIGRITPAGQITEFPLPMAGRAPTSIAAGPDGNLWFGEVGRVGRITPAGVITEFPVPVSGVTPTVAGITAGPDGNMWFTTANKSLIGRVNPAGVITMLPAESFISVFTHITVGPDGNIWYQDDIETPSMLRVTPAGVVTRFVMPEVFIGGIASGPDGNLWYTNTLTGAIGRIAPATGAVVGETPQPIAGTVPLGIASGPDGNMWFVESGANVIGRITPSGVMAGYALPSAGAPRAITAGPDGNMWFTEYATGKIGRISTGVDPAPPATPATPTSPAPKPAPVAKARTRLVVPALHLRTIAATRKISSRCTRTAAGRCIVTATITGKAAKRLGLTRSAKKPFIVARTTVILKKPGTRPVVLRITPRTARALRPLSRITMTYRATGPNATAAAVTRVIRH